MAKSKYGMKWSEEETILAFYYYKNISFGSIGTRNPVIIQLAALLGRTPGSVAMKLCNLSAFDPELQKRNVSGLRNASKTDEKIVERFLNHQDELVHLAQSIEARLKCELSNH